MTFNFGFPIDEPTPKRKRLNEEITDLNLKLQITRLKRDIKVTQKEIAGLGLTDSLCDKCRSDMSTEPIYALIPCGHVNFCESCVKDLKKCPMGCSGEISGVLALHAQHV